MDFLGSILGNMSGPPTMSEKEKERRKKERELKAKYEENLKKETKMMRDKTESRINKFLSETTGQKKITFPPMAKHHRSIVHDVAEVIRTCSIPVKRLPVKQRIVGFVPVPLTCPAIVLSGCFLWSHFKIEMRLTRLYSEMYGYTQDFFNILSSCSVVLRFQEDSFIAISSIYLQVAGLVAYSFGEEDVDRYTIVWKKEFQPSDEELQCLR